MIASALLLSLAFAKTDLIAVHAGSTQEQAHRLLTAALSKETIIDATGLHGYLLEPPNLLGMQDFEGFSASSPAGWPAALRSTWTEGVDYCHELVGPPPWNARDPTNVLIFAVSCGNRLAAFLWQRYLEQEHPDRVVILKVQEQAGGGLAVSATGYTPRGTEQWQVHTASSKVDAERDLQKVITSVLAGEGSRTPRSIPGELFTPLATDPFATEPQVSTPVPKARSCEALPQALSIRPDGVTAKSVAARWAASVKGTRPAAQCALTFTQHAELASQSLGVAGTTTSTVLRCGDQTVMTEVAKGLAPHPGETVSGRLVEGLAARWCH